MKSEVGAELACRAHEYDFAQDGKTLRHGVVSYFAAQSLPQATTVPSWLARIEQASKALPPFYQPSLQIISEKGAH